MSWWLKPYPAMKDSGLPWLGEVPDSWRILRGKNVFQIIDIRSETGTEELLTVSAVDGVVPRSQKTVTMFKAESYVGHKLCWPGDVVINSLWAWMQGLGIARHHGLISSAYSVYRPRPAFTEYANYFHYALRSAAYKWELQTRSKGVWLSRLQLSDSAFLDMPFVLPPPDQLPAIVRFLDHADRRIRCFIAAKRRLIKLLNEQKQAIIQKAVTRGLNPNVRFKPSAVEWLGDVPEHWEVKRLKWVVRLQRGYDLPQDKRVPGPIPVVSSGGVIDMHSEHRALGPGVVMGRYGSTDAVFFIENDFWPHNTALYVTDFQGNDPGWCYYLLRTISKAAYAAKSAVPGVDRKDLYEIYVPQPARQEQVSVVRELEKQLGSVNSCIESLRGEIEVVREYNTRLISDVVTGKLDVCGVELPPLEEAEELPPVGDAALYEAAEEETDLEPVEERADSAD